MLRRTTTILGLTLTIVAILVVGCGQQSSSRTVPVACADTMDAFVAPTTTTKAPAVTTTTRVKPPTTTTTTKKLPEPPKGTTTINPPGEQAYVPPANVKQPQEDIDAAKSSLKSDQKLSKGGSYESPVTHHVYHWHDDSYYSHLRIHDPYDPYDPYNWHNGNSPFNGYHLIIVDAC